MEFAFGFMGMTTDEYWNSTRREFYNRIKGFERWTEIIDLKEDRRARGIAYTVYCSIPRGKVDPVKSIEAFWPLTPAENRNEIRRQAKEQAIANLPKEIKWLKSILTEQKN